MPIICFDRCKPGFAGKSEYKMIDGKYTEIDTGVWPEGAYCSLDSDNSIQERERLNGSALVLWETHKGLCLYDYEQNGYHDSDFFMVVWNPEIKSTETICFASTRGWTYPAYGSKPDASPEIIAEYESWKKKKQRDSRACSLKANRKKLIDLRKKIGFDTYHPIVKLEKACYKKGYTEGQYNALVKLVSGNLRNEFRKSMAKQVKEWMMQKNNKYDFPLSYKQMQYL